jgi:hypothetical protein
MGLGSIRKRDFSLWDSVSGPCMHRTNRIGRTPVPHRPSLVGMCILINPIKSWVGMSHLYFYPASVQLLALPVPSSRPPCWRRRRPVGTQCRVEGRSRASLPLLDSRYIEQAALGIVGRRQHRAARDPTPAAAPFVLYVRITQGLGMDYYLLISTPYLFAIFMSFPISNFQWIEQQQKTKIQVDLGLCCSVLPCVDLRQLPESALDPCRTFYVYKQQAVVLDNLPADAHPEISILFIHLIHI